MDDLSRELRAGGPDLADRILPIVYAELQAMARRQMAQERPGHTLQATALVHEAFLKLVRGKVSWSSRAEFFHAAARAMQQLLVDHARSAGSLKRGGARARVPLSVVDLAGETDPAEIVALDEALLRLEQRDPFAARVVRLRFFAGLSVQETAACLEVSERTVKREWSVARAWLYSALDRAPTAGDGDVE